jgi:hypothetical protein
VKAYTDALRMELEHDGAPIAVTLIKPAAIDTPYTRHAKTLLGEEPQNPPPLYDPYLVADAIVACAVKPRRDVYIGGGGFAIMALARLAPRLGDLMMEKTMFAMQRSGRPPHEGSALYEPLGPHRERSGDPHMLPARGDREPCAFPRERRGIVLHGDVVRGGRWVLGNVSRRIIGERTRGREAASQRRRGPTATTAVPTRAAFAASMEASTRPPATASITLPMRASPARVSRTASIQTRPPAVE